MSTKDAILQGGSIGSITAGIAIAIFGALFVRGMFGFAVVFLGLFLIAPPVAIWYSEKTNKEEA